MTGAEPRRLAARVLAAVDGGAWSDEALADALDASRLAPADRALATRLVYGSLAWRRTLDHTLAAASARPLARLDPDVRTALRLGLFQMAFLDRVPDHAAISTSVDLVARRAASARGFVNAILRRVQREGLAPPPDAPADTRLGVLTSHPDWLVELWRREMPGDAEGLEALLAANNEAAPTCYRALGDRDAAVAALKALGHEARAGRHAASAFVVDGPVLDLPGLAVVQGEASQLVVDLLDPQPGERVLDACAAPGGKTAAIAARVGPQGRVVACDNGPRAGARIRATLAAAGVAGGVVTVKETALQDSGEPESSFDAVLVDAPCSGLGTLRQHPEIRWRRDPDQLAGLASRQLGILRAAAALVKPGGRLVYSTCTIARVENDDVVAAFLASAPGFVPDTAPPLAPGLAALVDDGGALRTWPHRDGLDGFYALRMRRRDDAA